MNIYICFTHAELNSAWKHENIFAFYNISQYRDSTGRWHLSAQAVDIVVMENKDLFIPHNQLYVCWGSGDTRGQGFISHCIDFLLLEYFGFSITRVKYYCVVPRYKEVLFYKPIRPCVNRLNSDSLEYYKYFFRHIVQLLYMGLWSRQTRSCEIGLLSNTTFIHVLPDWFSYPLAISIIRSSCCGLNYFQETEKPLAFYFNFQYRDDILYWILHRWRNYLSYTIITMATDELAAQRNKSLYGNVIKRKHFPSYWPFVRGIHRSPVNSPPKGQWRGALMFALICAWTNSWANNEDTCNLRRYLARCDVIVMQWLCHWLSPPGLDLSQHCILPPSQTTPASSLCPQLLCPHALWLHSSNADSCPLHSTLSNQILPWPWPNGARCLASPPEYPNWWQATSASALSHLKIKYLMKYFLVCPMVNQRWKCFTNGTISKYAYLNFDFWVIKIICDNTHQSSHTVPHSPSW